MHRLEQATEDPSALTQETIIERLDPVEAARLDKVRNIGIAVRITKDKDGKTVAEWI
jgi:elongation factor G